jgi:hypothetical protein
MKCYLLRDIFIHSVTWFLVVWKLCHILRVQGRDMKQTQNESLPTLLVPDRSFMHISANEQDLPAIHLFNLVTHNHNSMLIYTRLLWWNIYFTIALCNTNSARGRGNLKHSTEAEHHVKSGPSNWRPFTVLRWNAMTSKNTVANLFVLHPL